MKEMIDYYQKIVAKDKYVVCSNIFNIISIFDSSFYSRNDYEILSGPQRIHLLALLEKHNHRQISGRVILSKDHGHQLKFIESVPLGTSPLDALTRNYNENDMFIVTPGTHLLFLMKEFHLSEDDAVIKEIYNLLSEQPVNLEQLLDLSCYEDYEPTFKKHFKKLKEYQNSVLENGLKNKRSLGSIF